MSRHPEVKWAQRSDKVYITIELPDANNPKVKLEPEGKFTFSATAGKDKTLYELEFDLYDRVNAEASKINIGLRNIFCIIQKEEARWWKKLLKSEEKRLPFLRVDWDKWVDEDEEKSVGGDMDLNDVDFSKLGMGGDEAYDDEELDDDYEPKNDAEDEEQPDEEQPKEEPVKEEPATGQPIEV